MAVYEDEGGTVVEGELVLRTGFEIGDHVVADCDDSWVVGLPVVEVASALYRGGGEGIMAAWETLVRWIDDSGYRLVGDGRERYHEWDDHDPSGHLMELRQPIGR